MTADDDDEQLFESLRSAAQHERAPSGLDERVLGHVAYRKRVDAARLPLPAPEEPSRAAPEARGVPRSAFAFALGAAAAALLALVLKSQTGMPSIAAERSRATGGESAATPPTARRAGTSPEGSTAPGQNTAAAANDVCAGRGVASGTAPLIDDFDDGDDAITSNEQRVGFWRWAREIDEPLSAPALLPVPRPGHSATNRLALHVKGGQLVDWGATVEFTFRPSCYDAAKYAGIAFQARGPGRIYVSPREVGVIPLKEGGTCESDCYNPHVKKVELGSEWASFEVRWAEVRQRGFGKAPLDPSRLNSLAFMVRAEDTPYDVWLDDVRFIPR